MPLSSAVAAYDHVLIDLDGTVWLGGDPLPGAVDAIAALREAGKQLVFLTNDVRHTPDEIVQALWGHGMRAARSEVVTAGAALQHHLAGRSGEAGSTGAFVIGSRAIVDHVHAAGLRVLNGTPHASRADVVVVAGHDGFDHRELLLAGQATLAGAELVATSSDPSFPMPDGPWPGTGAILAAVETMAGRRADAVVGKPGPAMYATAAERMTGARRGLAVGDRLDSDCAGARAAGLDAALVLTGAATRADAAAADPAPEHVAESLGELVLAR